ncbi:MAG: hypothetical protein AB7R89_16170 [Dehalococcoidia bacterium]
MSMVQLGGDWFDLPVRVTYRAAATLQDGDAAVFVPRTSPAHHPDYLADAEIDAVPITINPGQLGAWHGLAMAVDEDEDGVDLQCVHISRLLKSLPVPRDQTITNQPAGAIVKQVVTQVFGARGSSLLVPGRFTLAPPLISFDLTGQDTGSVVSTLQQLTGQELSISGSMVNWLPPLATAYEPWLSNGVDLVRPRRTIDHNDRIRRVYTRDDGGRELDAIDARATTTPWQTARIETTSETIFARQALQAIGSLYQSFEADHTWTVGLRDVGGHWAGVREGMALKLSTTIGFTDTCPVVRVLSRTYTEGSAVLALEVERLPVPVGGVATIGALVPVPSRVRRSSSQFGVRLQRVTKEILGPPTFPLLWPIITSQSS